LIKLRYSKGYKPGFKSPSIGNFPILAVLGAISSVFILFYFGLQDWIIEIILIIIGVVVFYIFKKK
jgi:amino acid transporter